MAAVTSAVVGAAVAVKSARDAKKARESAAKDQERAAIQSAKQLKTATRSGELDILQAQKEAAQRIALGTTEAESRLQPFLEPGIQAQQLATDQILGGAPISGGIADVVREAALAGVDPRIFATEGIQPELARQADLAVSGITPDINQSLLALGGQGIATAGDIGAIRSRGLESLADIAGGTGAQRASLLVGTGGQLQELGGSAREARLLGDVAGQQFRTSAAESLAGLAGRIL